jgi:hypothetical protein
MNLAGKFHSHVYSRNHTTLLGLLGHGPRGHRVPERLVKHLACIQTFLGRALDIRGDADLVTQRLDVFFLDHACRAVSP